MRIKCPRCGSTNTSPLRGGERFRCNDCGRSIASLPRFNTKSGVADYREAVNEVHFTVGGYDTGYPEVWMRKTAQGIELSVRPGHYGWGTVGPCPGAGRGPETHLQWE